MLERARGPITASDHFRLRKAMPPLIPSATRWIIDSLAGNDALDFSILKSLVATFPECLKGAPDAARERVALRCIQQVASLSTGGDVAPGAMLRVEASRSCEDMLLELIGKVGCSGTFDKDKLPPFTQDIQNIISMKKSTLPKTSIELLKEVDPEIASMVSPSQLDPDGSNQHGNDPPLCTTQDHGNKDESGFQQETSPNLVDETESRNLENDPITPTSVPPQPCTYNSMSYDHLQDDDTGAAALGASALPSASCDDSIQGGQSETNCPPGTATDPQQRTYNSTSYDHLQEDDTGAAVSGASALPSVSCDDSIQGGQSETNCPPGTATEHTTVFEEDDTGAAVLDVRPQDPEISLAMDENVPLGTMHASVSCDATLQGNTTEHLSKKDTEPLSKKETEVDPAMVEPQSCEKKYPNAPSHYIDEEMLHDDGLRDQSLKLSNEVLDTGVAGTPTLDRSCNALPTNASEPGQLPKSVTQQMNDSPEVLQQDLCIKCGKAGQLLQCSGCLLAAHDSCFGSSVTSQESGLFYCPVCLYTKATESYQKTKKAYYEARKNVTTFLGTTQMIGQHDELASGILPSATNREVSDTLRRKNTHQHEGANVAHRDEEPDQQRKKQKVYAASHGCPEDMAVEKASTVQNSNFEIMNKYSVHKDNNNIKQVQDAERQQLGENKEAASSNLSHKTQTRCGTPANQEVEADKEDGPTKSHKPNDSDEIEATSSDDSIKEASSGNLSHETQTRCGPPANQEVEADKEDGPTQSHKSNDSDEIEATSSNDSIKEAASGNLSHETRCSSQTGCGPSANQEVEADKEDGPMKSHQSNDSDETEATSSNDSIKRSSPPWRKIIQRKSGIVGKETVASSNSRKNIAQQDQHISSPSRKRKYASRKRYTSIRLFDIRPTFWKVLILQGLSKSILQSRRYWKALQAPLDRRRRNNVEGSNGEICPKGRWPYSMGSDTRIRQGCVSHVTRRT